jgi:hypothetical protein
MFGNHVPMQGRLPMWAAAALGAAIACTPFASAAEAPNWQEHVTFTASNRLRGELVDWFELGAYYGHVFESSAIRTTFAAQDANFFFAELTFRY